VVGCGADATNPTGELRHFLGRTALAKNLESTQLGNLQVSAFDISLLVEEDFNFAVPFQACNRINGDSATAGRGFRGGTHRSYLRK
jgi:hypothetical protein